MKTSRPVKRGQRKPRRKIQTARAGGHVSQTTRDMEFLKQTIESEQRDLEDFLKGRELEGEIEILSFTRKEYVHLTHIHTREY